MTPASTVERPIEEKDATFAPPQGAQMHAEALVTTEVDDLRLAQRAKAAFITNIGFLTGTVLGGGAGVAELITKVKGAETARFGRSRRFAANVLAFTVVAARSGQVARAVEIGMEVLPPAVEQLTDAFEAGVGLLDQSENSAGSQPGTLDLGELDVQRMAAHESTTPVNHDPSPIETVKISSDDGLQALAQKVVHAYGLDGSEAAAAVQDIVSGDSKLAHQLHANLLAEGPGHENYKVGNNVALGYTGRLNSQDQAAFAEYFEPKAPAASTPIEAAPDAAVASKIDAAVARQLPGTEAEIDVKSYDSSKKLLAIWYKGDTLELKLPGNPLTHEGTLTQGALDAIDTAITNYEQTHPVLVEQMLIWAQEYESWDNTLAKGTILAAPLAVAAMPWMLSTAYAAFGNKEDSTKIEAVKAESIAQLADLQAERQEIEAELAAARAHYRETVLDSYKLATPARTKAERLAYSEGLAELIAAFKPIAAQYNQQLSELDEKIQAVWDVQAFAFSEELARQLPQPYIPKKAPQTV